MFANSLQNRTFWLFFPYISNEEANFPLFTFHFSLFFVPLQQCMKVLIINTSERTGGAAVAANRLTEALIVNGVKAKMLVRNLSEESSMHVSQTGTWLQNKWNFLFERFVIWMRNRFDRQNLFKVSIANTGLDLTKTHEFQDADIIHLHWVNQGFLSLRGIEKILKSGKPVVWTMHDMWEATGICHHAYDCKNFETECRNCPFLRNPGARDLSYQIFKKKQRVLETVKQGRGLTFVAVSNWLADRARQSALIGGLPITVIPNSISLSRFKMTDRDDARTALDVSEPYVISFGAARIDDPIKGFDYLVDALQILVKSGRLRRKELRLLLFGDVRDVTVFSQLPVPYTYLGYISDEDQLSLIYSASNATVSSSLYETFGQTLIEAMACGSIPVSFGGCGQADIISHRQTGYLAERLSADSLAEGIDWALKAQLVPRELRRSVSRRYVDSVVANQYYELYKSLSRPLQKEG